MLKQISEKNKAKSIQSQIFNADSFSREHPFTSCSALSCASHKGSCHCSEDKLVSYNRYVYRKSVNLNGIRRIIPLKRMVTDLDPELKPIRVNFEIKNWKCFRFEKLSAEKRKKINEQVFHAFLPVMVPKYGRYTYRFILTVLMDYVNRGEETVRKLCDRWSISVSTLYRWINLFSEQFSLIVSEIRSLTNGLLNRNLNAEKILLITPQLLHSFYVCSGGITFMEQSAWMRAGRKTTQ